MSIQNILNTLTKKNDSIIISYKGLRTLIGVLGILIPFINIIFGYVFANVPPQKVLSMYYYTNTRDFFVGILFVISLFMMTYRGYNLWDNIITSATGFFGLALAIFPTNNGLGDFLKVGIFQLTPEASDVIHLITATAFISLLAIISLFIFTQTNKKKKPTAQKILRNKIYIACGITIIVSLLCMLLAYLVLTEQQLVEYLILLICQSISFIAFGISWLTKGEAIFKDI